SSEWDSVKKELYGGTDSRVAELAIGGLESKYDPEQVEALKQGLLQSLTNATNIRYLKPDDFIGITVFGRAGAVLSVKKSRSKTSSSNSSSEARTDGAVLRKSNSDALREKEKVQAVELARQTAVPARTDLLRASTQGTVLTLRVKKADVEAFATGKLDLEAFEKKVEQHSYPGSGYGITSINSWSRSGTATVR